MLRPLTEPSTPLRKVVKVDGETANFSAPARARVNSIHLPPQELSSVLSQMPLRRNSVSIEANILVRKPATDVRLRNSFYEPHNSILSRPTSQKRTPTRRFSDHLTIRRRRRSSTGVEYDTAFSGAVNKDFLRLFSRTLAKENKQLREEPDEQVYRALDKQHRISSTSPQGPARDYDMSLPLPSDDELNSIVSEPTLPRHSALVTNPALAANLSMPASGSYLERILESRKRRPRSKYDLTHDETFSGELSRSHELNSVINTSQFIIENTLSGLPESWKGEDQTSSSLKLAEPVAFGLLRDDDPTDESSEMESAPSVSEISYHSARLPQIGTGIKTPDNYNIHFDNVDELDVPSWEPVPLFDETESVGKSEGADLDIPPKDENTESRDDGTQLLETELSENGIILGHYTVDNDDIIADDSGSLSQESPHRLDRVALSPLDGPRSASFRRSILSEQTDRGLPKGLLNGLVAVAQHLPTAEFDDGSSRKRRKTQKLNANLVSLISKKSDEFLLQVMLDIEAYSDHRSARQINVSDIVLFMNRVKSHHAVLGLAIDYPTLAHTVFPLELLVSLDNNLRDFASPSLPEVEVGLVHKGLQTDSDFPSSPSLEASRRSRS
mgnify:FL=1